MANNITLAELLAKKSYPTIKEGKHTVKIQHIDFVEDIDDVDKSYVAVSMEFDNGRTTSARWYRDVGGSILISQLRKQSNDETVYDSELDFLKGFEGKSVNVWISQETCTDDNDKTKNTLRYNFVEPRVGATATEENDPF